MTRIASLLALFGLTACLISKPIGQAETDTATSTADESSDGPGMTSMIDTTGDPDGDPFRVDCAERDWSMDDVGELSGVVGGGPPGPLGFPIAACNPRTSGEANGYRCCSTDPATADGALPAYELKGITGSAPLYADAANGAGTWGVCINSTNIPAGSGLLSDAAANCPIPCNPTWSDQDVDAVCGSGRVCCQTHEVREKDCVQDDGVWRPVTGNDIGNPNIVPATNWNSVAHDTHQDPNGTVCLAAAGGDASSELFVDCIRQLDVANQRGFCLSLQPGQVCPGDRDLPPSGAGYRDVCDMMNG
ncbi:MAG TPA: hypothetical protein VG755_14060 [Nannocystaceae bacterium]|nr:hypothetical protein [Nannocystaceae bacterium]